MTEKLPPGVWDNPTPDEMPAYNAFVEAWFAEGGDVELSALSYGYGYGYDDSNCPTGDCADSNCGCFEPSCNSPNKEEGQRVEVSVDLSSRDGTWFRCSTTETTEQLYFGWNWWDV